MATQQRPTFAEMTDSQRQKVAEALWARERPTCQSALVDDLLKAGELDGFQYEDIENLYPDPSDWGVLKCHEWLRDMWKGEPDGDSNPFDMDRAAMVEALTGISIECRDDESDDVLREAVISAMDDGDIPGLEEWRSAVSDDADAAEIYEWWEVGDWLAERLAEAGECVLRNGYGDWWGRCCTGQSVTLDHVIQKLGAEYCGWAIDKD